MSTISCSLCLIFKRTEESTNSPFFPSTNSKGFATKAMASPTVSTPKREKDPKKRVVIAGMGLVSVFGNDADAFYSKLLDGVSGITPIDRFDASEFSVRFAGQIRNFSSDGYVDGEMDRDRDDCWRYSLVAGKRALDDANLGPEVLRTMNKRRMGVVIGTASGGLTSLSKGVEAIIEKEHTKISPLSIPYTAISMGSALLAVHTGFMGPTYSISTACASANHCFIAAANHIREGDADVMVAGGAEAPVSPSGLAGFIACRALSERNDEPHKASRPWDRDRDGFVLGEGAGFLIMESLEHAMKRGATIMAEFLGGAITCDAYHITNPRTDGLGVSTCIVKSLENARVSPEEVNYVNAHATSTLAGDLVEANAIKEVFKNTSHMKMNATKNLGHIIYPSPDPDEDSSILRSMIGHALGASGGLEAIATIKAINTGWLHPTLNQYDLEPSITIDTIPNVKKRHQINIAISNSFGFGGQNSVAVFAPFEP